MIIYQGLCSGFYFSWVDVICSVHACKGILERKFVLLDMCSLLPGNVVLIHFCGACSKLSTTRNLSCLLCSCGASELYSIRKKRGKLGRGNGEKSIRFFLCVIQLFSIKRLLLILVYWSVGGRLCVA